MNDRAVNSLESATGESAAHGVPARAGEVLPGRLFLLPLSERPYFPVQTQPLVLREDLWLETLKQADEAAQRVIGLVYVSEAGGEAPRAADFPAIGTAVRIHHPRRDDGTVHFIAEGLGRFRIVKWIARKPPYQAQVEYPDAGNEGGDEVRAYALALINTIKELLPLNPLYNEPLKAYLNRFGPSDPSPLADFTAVLTSASGDELQDVLETVPLLPRMERVLVLVHKELEVARIQARLRQKVEDAVSERQRRFFLKEQLKQIQQELGLFKDDRAAELDRFRERSDRLELAPNVRERLDEEMRKFSVLESGSPEYAVSRNYLDWITSLPWGVYSEDKLDLARARRLLDRQHAGLDDVKDRIMEFLALGVYRGEIAGSILLLVGPPGVGKTSVGRSIADALGRRFYRLSLGGLRDEAEIKGHRRTYIGAMPGKFIQALKEAGYANPVIMLDELDKVGASYRGDPASALLEVLDPEQNSDFLDHYLDVRFDLSKVLFVCTANQLDTIARPLLDRMEVIRLAGYITPEKLRIARRHLWPKQLDRAGLRSGQLKITDGALRALIEGYAREAGVRNLEKQLGRIVRKAVVRLLEGAQEPVRIGVRDLDEYLGPRVFRREHPARGVGVVTGLAWTPLGGAVLSIEATLVHTKNRGFKLTGQLGAVMKESAEIAYSYVAANLDAFDGDPAFFDQAFVHLHVPEGATPKDGPSAGITMATALLSLARGRRPARVAAMSGELTLTGRVLPVGGIREKLIAARRNRVTEIILPEANRRDFDELPGHVREGLKLHFVKHYREVPALVFGAGR